MTSAKAAAMVISLLALALALFLAGGLFFALSFSPTSPSSLLLSRYVSASLVKANDSSSVPLDSSQSLTGNNNDNSDSSSAEEKDIFFWRPFEAMCIANNSTATLEELLKALEESMDDREREKRNEEEEEDEQQHEENNNKQNDNDSTDDDDNNDDDNEEEDTNHAFHSLPNEKAFSAAKEANITSSSTATLHLLTPASLAALQSWLEHQLTLCAAELRILFLFDTEQMHTHKGTARVLDERREDIDNLLAFSGDGKRLFPACQSLLAFVGQYGEIEIEIEIERLYESILMYSQEDNDNDNDEEGLSLNEEIEYDRRE